MSGRADYRFLPWVRRGFRPSAPDPLSGPVADPSEFTIRLTAEAERADGTASTPTEETVDVRMYGPGDVLGFDHRQVVRVEPEPGTRDFEPNYFPTVELDRPSLPWLFSPADAASGGKLRPWLCLVVVRRQPGVTLTTGTRRETPILEIGGDADPAAELPDLEESWAWAHAQVVGGPTGGEPGGQWVTEQLETNSSQTVARLVAPRRLQPNESYHACVVPVFEPGRRAGLGLEPFPDSVGEGDSAGDRRRVAPAWDLADVPERIRLPVYFDWEFATGSGGDFEDLVGRLDPTELTSVGFRTVDASDPGPDELAEHRPTDVRVEGALRSAGLDPLPYPSGARDSLAGLLGRVDVTGDDPTFGPPVYGQRHAGVSALPDRPAEVGGGTEGADGVVPWLRELNVDPRHRIAAGYGTRIVQNEQEALMQSAWTQVDEVRRANRLLQRGQLAREVSQGIHDDVTSLPGPERFAFTAAMQHRVRSDDGRTVGADLRASSVPSSALTLTFRRLTRPGGPLGSRISGDASGRTPSPAADVVGAFAPERLAAMRREETGSPSPFPFESERPPDGTVTTGSDDDEAVADYCAELESQRGAGGDPWPPVWVADIDPEAFPGLGRTICDHAERVLERFEAEVPEETPANGSLQHLLERFRSAWDPVRPGMGRYEEAVGGEDRREQVAVLADLVGRCDEATDALVALEARLDADPTVESARNGPLLAAYRPLTWLTYGLAILLREVAYDHLRTDLCALSRELADRVEAPAEPAEAPGDALLAQLTGVSELLCGTEGSGGSAGRGLLHEIDGSLRTADEDAHRASVRRFRDLQRLVAIARDRSDRLAAGGEALADLSGLYADFAALVDHVGDGIGTPEDPVAARLRDLLCDSGRPPRFAILAERPDEDVVRRLTERVTTALDPTRTVEAAVTARISGLRAARERTAVREGAGGAGTGPTGPVDPLDPVMAAPSFPQPMYESLRDLDVEHLLPGVGDVPPDSLGLLETNPAFVEACLVGLNHEMARELNWREYPTDRRGTYFRRFWDRRGAVPPRTGTERDDIEGIHRWPAVDGATRLGGNLLRGGATSDAVLLVRGELLRRYPNTVVYAVMAERVAGKRRPVTDAATEAPPPGTPGVEYPVFRGTIDPDITFLGFDVSTEDLLGDTAEAPEGYFLVVEEAPGEPRFGLDEPGEPGEGEPGGGFGWEDATWAHVAPDGDPDALSYVPVPPDGPPGVPSPPTAPFEWGKNGAHMAGITWQKPFRIGVHASDMLPNEGGP